MHLFSVFGYTQTNTAKLLNFSILPPFLLPRDSVHKVLHPAPHIILFFFAVGCHFSRRDTLTGEGVSSQSHIPVQFFDITSVWKAKCPRNLKTLFLLHFCLVLSVQILPFFYASLNNAVASVERRQPECPLLYTLIFACLSFGLEKFLST